MKMITKIFSYIYSTDFLPIVGGATGAIAQSHKLITFFPSWESIIATIIIALVGAVVGYLVKLSLDILFRKFTKKTS